MKKRLKLILVFIGLFSLLQAEGVSVERARIIASNFLLEQIYAETHADKSISDLSLYKTFFCKKEHFPLMYIFKNSNKGFVIISADDNYYPVLGFSFDNPFEKDNMPPALDMWLKQYSFYINEHKGNKLSRFDDVWQYYSDIEKIRMSKSKVKGQPPLLNTNWNQDVFYNAFCPADTEGSGGHVYAGCVATAMAQVMKYYNYPPQGQGSKTYYDWGYGALHANFGATTYNWNYMPNSISSYNDAIAELLFHCGVSVEMSYSPYGSGAYSEDVVTAAVNYFKYSTSTNIKDMYDYTAQQWINMLKANLDNLMPLYYSGYSDQYGHAFNCDGYMSTPHGTHFHFNWGWGGSGNGYFYLDNMSSPGGDFNYWHQAIFDMIPAANFPVYCTGQTVLTAQAGNFEDGSSLYHYENNADCYWLISPLTNVASIKLSFDRFDTEANFDFVRVYDGDNISAPLLGEFSGNSKPSDVFSTGNSMLVRFTTNSNGIADGWRASYTTNNHTNCSNITILTAPAGNFEDGSLQYFYNINTNCRWRIEPPGATQITLGFHDFALHPDEGVLQVFDISGTTSLLDEYFGFQLPPEKTYNASKILVWFKSGKRHYDGWAAYYASNVAGIEYEKENILSVYPNPFVSELNILYKGKNASVEVMTSCGQSMLKVNDFREQLSIDLSTIAAGVYFLKVYDNENSFVKKIVKY